MDFDKENRLTVIAEIFKALSNPGRLALLEKLAQGPRCVCELAQELRMNKSITSKHLSYLYKVGLLRSQKQGVTVRYELTSPCVIELSACTLELVQKEIVKRWNSGIDT